MKVLDQTLFARMPIYHADETLAQYKEIDNKVK